MPHLFSPLTIKDITLRNRIGVSPMCQYSAEDGVPNDWHFVHLGSRAVGGAGLVIVEATAVEPRGRISPEDLGIYTDQHIEPFKRITAFLKEHGAVPGIQLAHAGRKASTYSPWKEKEAPAAGVPNDQGGWDVVGPSAIPFNDGYKEPKELSVEEIKEIQENFRQATIRAREAGFEWMEFHGAHGYLAHSFYSPLSNKRTDEYGGSFDNRIRFVLETVRVMRQEWPENLPFTVRISSTDWVDDGWTLEESIELSKRLKQEGVDLIDCSSGGNVPKRRSRSVPVTKTFLQKNPPASGYCNCGRRYDHTRHAGRRNHPQRKSRSRSAGPRASTRSILAASCCGNCA